MERMKELKRLNGMLEGKPVMVVEKKTQVEKIKNITATANSELFDCEVKGVLLENIENLDELYDVQETLKVYNDDLAVLSDMLLLDELKEKVVLVHDVKNVEDDPYLIAGIIDELLNEYDYVLFKSKDIEDYVSKFMFDRRFFFEGRLTEFFNGVLFYRINEC